MGRCEGPDCSYVSLAFPRYATDLWLSFDYGAVVRNRPDVQAYTVGSSEHV